MAKQHEIVGVDIGYGNIKIAYGNGDVPQVMILPGGVGLHKLLSQGAQINGQVQPGLYPDGVRVTVKDTDGDGMLVEKEMVAGVDRSRLPGTSIVHHNDFPSTIHYMALYYAVLSIIADSEQESKGVLKIDTLVTGLPVNQATKENRRALSRRLAGEHRVNSFLSVFVNKVTVVAQPMGGYWDAAKQFTTEPHQKVFSQGRVLVLDPGFFSLDWALFDQSYLNNQASGSNNLAMHRILSHVQDEFHNEYGEELKIYTIERAIREGHYNVLFGAKDLNIKYLVDKAFNTIAGDVVTELHNAKQFDREKIDMVVLVGGGAQIYSRVARKAFPHSLIAISPDPVVANARGYWYAGWMNKQASS